MGRTLGIVMGAAMALIGAIWTFQGLGYLHGSPMTGVAFWAKIGPAVAGLGAALMIVAFTRPRQ